MDRRTALKNASLVLGFSLTAPAISAILSGCSPEVVPNYEPKFFAKDQMGTIKALIDTIIPKTDTPSASEVGVLEFMDKMLAEVMEPEAQQNFKSGLADFISNAGATSFEEQTEGQRIELMTKMEKLASESEGPKNEQFWYMAKGLAVNGYMLSEEIATNHLAYDPIPGEYIGCTDLSVSEGKSWAL